MVRDRGEIDHLVASDAGCSREFVSMIHLKACKAHFVVRRAADVPAPFYADDPAEVVDVVLR